jgi:ABC-type transporter Mla maintaining outer membrane lipid asymmetry ATPase subunit MlaF
MSAPVEPLLRLRGVTKSYHSLRPLRIEQLDIFDGESVALLGFDAAMAEVFVNLVTGASVPDSGEVTAFGQRTTDIADTEGWMTILDRFGLITDRAVLLDQLTAEQSLVMPISLELDNMSPELGAAAAALAEEVGLAGEHRTQPVTHLSPALRLRVRLGRALALDPRIVIAEHPNASLPPDELPRFAADFARVAANRRLASIVLTADPSFAHSVADRVLTLQPATGALKPSSRWRKWFS